MHTRGILLGEVLVALVEEEVMMELVVQEHQDKDLLEVLDDLQVVVEIIPVVVVEVQVKLELLLQVMLPQVEMVEMDSKIILMVLTIIILVGVVEMDTTIKLVMEEKEEEEEGAVTAMAVPLLLM